MTITSYADAPARTIAAGGQTYAYRELGPQGGVPVVFFVHLAAIKAYGRSRPSDLSVITGPTLIANGDHDRTVPSEVSEDLHRRVAGSELIIYPDSGHGGVFQHHEQFAPVVADFLAD